MIKIVCYIRPHKLEAVKSAISAVGVSGMTVSDIRGTGNSEETPSWFGGEQQLIALPIRSKIEVVLPDELREDAVQAILSQAQTGEAGDGKNFIEPVTDAIRIRTEERGGEAI